MCRVLSSVLDQLEGNKDLLKMDAEALYDFCNNMVKCVPDSPGKQKDCEERMHAMIRSLHELTRRRVLYFLQSSGEPEQGRGPAAITPNAKADDKYRIPPTRSLFAEWPSAVAFIMSMGVLCLWSVPSPIPTHKSPVDTNFVQLNLCSLFPRRIAIVCSFLLRGVCPPVCAHAQVYNFACTLRIALKCYWSSALMCLDVWQFLQIPRAQRKCFRTGFWRQ